MNRALREKRQKRYSLQESLLFFAHFFSGPGRLARKTDILSVLREQSKEKYRFDSHYALLDHRYLFAWDRSIKMVHVRISIFSSKRYTLSLFALYEVFSSFGLEGIIVPFFMPYRTDNGEEQ
jgi:hypothetical protein